MTNKSTLLKTGLILGSALVLSITSSLGDTETFDESPGFTLVGNGASTTVDLTSFDTTLGTLTEVDLSLANVDVTGNLSITNNAVVSQTFKFITINGDYTVTDSTPNTVELTTSNSEPNQTVASGDTVVLPFDSGIAPTQTTVLTGSNVSPYETVGPGTVDVNLAADNAFSVSASGNATETLTSQGTGNIDVTYVYTPVPEPAQTASYLMGFGLLLLMGRMYLKKQGSLLA